MINRRTGPYNNKRYQYTDYDDINNAMNNGLIENSLQRDARYIGTSEGLGPQGSVTPTLPPNIGNVNASEGLGPQGSVTPTLPPNIGNVNASEGLGPQGSVTPTLPPNIGNVNASEGLGPQGSVTPTLPPNIGNVNASEGLGPQGSVTPTLPPNINGSVTILPIIPIQKCSYVKFLNSNSSVGGIDIYVNGSIVVSNLTFGESTNYIKLYSKRYRITVYNSGRINHKIYEVYYTFNKNDKYTMTFKGSVDSYSFMILKNNCNSINISKSEIRFINTSSNSPLIDVYIDGIIVIKGFDYNDVSRYLNVFEGFHNITLTISNTMNVIVEEPNINFSGGMCYGIYIIGDYNARFPLQLDIINETKN